MFEKGILFFQLLILLRKLFKFVSFYFHFFILLQ